jgi:hypothetical protein
MSGISMLELDRQSVEPLPHRETMALINIANITAVNIAIAVNAATVGSTAQAQILQGIAVGQG